jgi:major membrane immunogen (membrane-anchored lipoprotein)
MNKKVLGALCAASFALTLLPGCGKSGESSYADGSYVGQSGKDDRGAYGEVTLTIKDGKVATCDCLTWQKDGSVKDEDYGKVNGKIENEEMYAKAQLAVDAMQKYADQFEEVKDIEGVDAISGATISYDQFVEAVTKALKEAEQK